MMVAVYIYIPKVTPTPLFIYLFPLFMLWVLFCCIMYLILAEN